jgi:hypothetical protein
MPSTLLGNQGTRSSPVEWQQHLWSRTNSCSNSKFRIHKQNYSIFIIQAVLTTLLLQKACKTELFQAGLDLQLALPRRLDFNKPETNEAKFSNESTRESRNFYPRGRQRAMHIHSKRRQTFYWRDLWVTILLW